MADFGGIRVTVLSGTVPNGSGIVLSGYDGLILYHGDGSYIISHHDDFIPHNELSAGHINNTGFGGFLRAFGDTPAVDVNTWTVAPASVWKYTGQVFTEASFANTFDVDTASVKIEILGDDSSVLGSTTISSNGTWSALARIPLTMGPPPQGGDTILTSLDGRGGVQFWVNRVNCDEIS